MSRHQTLEWTAAPLVVVSRSAVLMAVITGLSWSNALPLAGSTNAPLTVGVTVTRTCLVTTTPLDPGFAALHLTCAPATTAVTDPADAGDQLAIAPAGSYRRVPTGPAPSAPENEAVRLVTFNF